MSADPLAFPDDFDWLAPVPQPFTRSDGRVFWPGDRRYRPLDLAFRQLRDLKALTQALPAELSAILHERFKPTRGPLIWDTPPALPTSIREGYTPERLKEGTGGFVYAEITVTAGLIERLLNAPEGMVGGLTHNYLLVMQIALAAVVAGGAAARVDGGAAGRLPARAGVAPSCVRRS